MSQQNTFPTVLTFHVMDNVDGFRIVPTFSIDKNVDENGELVLPLEGSCERPNKLLDGELSDQDSSEIMEMLRFDEDVELTTISRLPTVSSLTHNHQETHQSSSWDNLWALVDKIEY